MKYILALLLLTTPACGSQFNEFGGYVEKFQQYAKEQRAFVMVFNLNIHFGTINPLWLAECRHGIMPEIVVSEKYWDELTETKKELVMLHELGHCILNRGHDDGFEVGDKRLFKSIMNSQPTKLEDYTVNKSAYLKELFGVKNAKTYHRI